MLGRTLTYESIKRKANLPLNVINIAVMININSSKITANGINKILKTFKFIISPALGYIHLENIQQ